MLNYLKRRFSSTELINEIKSGVGYGAPQSQQQRPTQEYKYLPEEVRKQTVEEMSTQNVADSGRTVSSRMAFPSAPSSPTKQGSVGGGGGFMNTVTGQLNKAKHLFSTETLNSIIQDAKVPGLASEPKCKVLLVIDHPFTDWAKYLHKRKIHGDWEIRVEQAQMNDISITSSPDSGCSVTVQYSKGANSSTRQVAFAIFTFKPDFVLIRQGLGSATQHYENLITGFIFGGVPCLNSIEAVYNMRNKAWLFCNLIGIQKKLGASEFPLIPRSYQAKSQPSKPDFQMPVNVRLGGDSSRECEVRVDDPALYQSMMCLASTTQRYATTEPCIQGVCDIFIQKIGNFTKAFMRKPIRNPSLGSSSSTVLEKIPVSPTFQRWITEVAQLFGGLDMCAIKAQQDIQGDYYILDVYGSDFTLFGDGQEEDRSRIAELIVQRMMQAQTLTEGRLFDYRVPRTVSRSQVAPASARPSQTAMSAQVYGSPPSMPEPPADTIHGQGRNPQLQQSTFTKHDQQRQAAAPPLSTFSSSQTFREPVENEPKPSPATVDFSPITTPLRYQMPERQSQFDSPPTRTESRDKEAKDATTTIATSGRAPSMDFSSQPRSVQMKFGREETEGASAIVGSSVKRKPSDTSVGRDVQATREPFCEGNITASGQTRMRPTKEAAPQPPRQASLTGRLDTPTKSTVSTNIFEPSMNIFQPESHNQPLLAGFQSQPKERVDDPASIMKFDNLSSMDFGQLKTRAPPCNDPWSVPTTQSPAPVDSKPQTTPTLPFTSKAVPLHSEAPRQTPQLSPNPDDTDDTMKNLRKTFAGIFGDI
ncbi:unnamed protein product [Mesocestoides corti]|uniref:Synapsin ATP-binding domain-containing protein n=1 Tax=Mesocestoides corti TaxID=53468 RepID=A0A158QTA7_MESCO|nr:unnamed protein product [Mesocestoides corti]